MATDPESRCWQTKRTRESARAFRCTQRSGFEDKLVSCKILFDIPSLLKHQKWVALSRSVTIRQSRKQELLDKLRKHQLKKHLDIWKAKYQVEKNVHACRKKLYFHEWRAKWDFSLCQRSLMLSGLFDVWFWETAKIPLTIRLDCIHLRRSLELGDQGILSRLGINWINIVEKNKSKITWNCAQRSKRDTTPICLFRTLENGDLKLPFWSSATPLNRIMFWIQRSISSIPGVRSVSTRMRESRPPRLQCSSDGKIWLKESGYFFQVLYISWWLICRLFCRLKAPFVPHWRSV